MGSVFKYLLPLAFGLVATLTGVAQAQDYSAGKTPAQLFASDCSACHKSPQGLSKADPRSLASFLREHYTTKQETAGALAAFVAAANTGPAAGEGKPRPGGAREKPEPASTSGKPRRPEAPVEGAQAGHPAPKPRAAVGPEPKPGDEAKPAGRRQPAAARAGIPSEGAKPEAHDGAKPASRTREPKPAVAVKRDGEKPAQAARPDGNLESYLSSGEAAKPAETEASAESDQRLHSYATSGGGIAALTDEVAKPAAASDAAGQSSPVQGSAPAAEPLAAEAAKPASSEESKPAAPPARNRPRRAAAPIDGETPSEQQ